MGRVLIDGVDTPMARRLATRWSDDAVIVGGPPPWGVEPGSGPLDVVLWGSGSSLDIDGSGRPVVDPASVMRWCDSLRDAAVRHVTLVSSALVFGPSPDHPVPLGETAAMTTWPVGHPARRWADIEDVVGSYASRAGCALAILRPVVIAGAVSSRSPLGENSPWNPHVVPVEESDPYRQFLHADDLADAVRWASENRVVGTFHVAPHGWIRASHQLELSGRLFTRGAGTVRDDSDGAFSDPVLRSYLATSLVVSSDALAAAGWSARRTNEEAVIDSAGEGWWSSLTARRRQDVSLAALVASGAAVAASGVAAVRWWSRRGRG